MIVLSGIAGGEPVAVIDFPTASTAIVVTNKGRVRAVRISQLEILRDYYTPASVWHGLNEANTEVKRRRMETRTRKRSAALGEKP